MQLLMKYIENYDTNIVQYFTNKISTDPGKQRTHEV